MNDNGGCMFSILATAVVALLVIGGAIWLTHELSGFQDAQAARMYAEAALQDAWGRSQAMIIQAQGQARLDSAEAFTIMAIAALPWMVLGLVGLSTIVLLGCAVTMVALLVPRRPLVQKHVLVYLPLHQSRRLLCQNLNEFLGQVPVGEQETVEVECDRGD